MKKIIFPCLIGIISCLTVTFVWADNALEKAIQNTEPASTTTTYHSGSGYQKDIKVIEKTNFFANYRFSKKDFQKWLYLFQYAKSLEYFQGLIEKGTIDPNGELKIDTIKIGKITKTKPAIIELEDIFPSFQEQYTSTALMAELQDNQILDQDGYLIFPQTVPMDFDQIDFTFLLTKIEKIDFDFTDPKLERALCRELTQYMSNECKTVLVKQEENTTYRSRQDNFFSGIGDYFMGNLIGSVLYPSRISEVKQKIEWNPNINIADYFPNLIVGFNRYPFHYGSRGIVLFNGQTTLADINVDYMNQNNQHQIGVIWEGRNAYQYSLTQRAVNFTQITLQSNIFKEKESLSLLGFYSVSVGAGMASNQFLMDWLVGLTYRKGDLSDNLGFNWGAKINWFCLPLTSLDLDYTGFFQPNFPAHKSEWDLSKARFNVSFYLNRLELKTGYQWFYNSNNTILDQWFVSAGMFF